MLSQGSIKPNPCADSFPRSRVRARSPSRAEPLVRITVDGEKVTGHEHIEIGRRIREVRVAPDRSIWLLTEHKDGELVRVSRGDTSQNP